MADLSGLERGPRTSGHRAACLVCGGAGTPWLERRGRRMVRCDACGFAWVPEGVLHTSRDLSIYEDEDLDLYAQDRDYYRDVGAVDAAREKLEWVTRFSRPDGRLLDVGANVGSFVREAMNRFDAVGIEPNARTVAWGQEHLGARLEVGSIFEEAPQYVGRFDAVTVFDVIEHLDDPAAALRQCRRYLAPGGRLFITTPDMGSVGARLQGRAWYYLDLDQHISMFPAAGLVRVLASEGLRVIDRRSFGRRYRFSYIERRLKDLSHQSAFLRLAHVAALPLRLAPERHVPINLGDVVGLVAEAAPAP
jgi:2-polyprenyl-3-methyl-5-hydroxy-6-metoxy-1,4-benzoquinol methylase